MSSMQDSVARRGIRIEWQESIMNYLKENGDSGFKLLILSYVM